jgi:hypothetical protein
MAVRSTMASLITRVRVLINDPSGASQVFDDQTIQDVMDESRLDYRNEVLQPKPTFSGSQIQYLDYWHSLGGWEDSPILKQYLTNTVTPSASEPIAGHWTFAASILPPVYITGSLHDAYKAAADLLERRAAQWMMSYNVAVDGQNLQRSQVLTMMLNLAKQYRMKQRPGVIHAVRGDLNSSESLLSAGLGPLEIDRMSSGNGS